MVLLYKILCKITAYSYKIWRQCTHWYRYTFWIWLFSFITFM